MVFGTAVYCIPEFIYVTNKSCKFFHILVLILALKQLLNECGIGTENNENSVVGQHRALVFCQLKAMMDIVERDLLKSSMMSNVTYLR